VLRPVTITRAPARAKARAMPRPMPLDPPVMTATLPETSCMCAPSLTAAADPARSAPSQAAHTAVFRFPSVRRKPSGRSGPARDTVEARRRQCRRGAQSTERQHMSTTTTADSTALVEEGARRTTRAVVCRAPGTPWEVAELELDEP